MQNELVEIIDIENSTPLSWYDWWNYWSTFIGIFVFILIFILLTVNFYLLNPIKKEESVIQQENIDDLVASILHKKALTL